MIRSYLYIETTKGKGRGVFTKKNIPAGKVIEVSPVIVMKAGEKYLIDQTILHDYIFLWGEETSECCLGLGFLSMYNHSYTSNCEYFMEYDKQIMFIKTVREVQADEELTINYNGDWDNKKRVWFDTAD